MERIKYILTTLLSFGAIISGIALVSCTTNESVYDNNYIYFNDTDVVVDIISYETLFGIVGSPTYIETKKTILPGDSQMYNAGRGGGDIDPGTPIESDSVRVVFNGDREILFKRGEEALFSVFDRENYTTKKASKYLTEHYYYITDEVYQTSTPIAE